MRKNRERQDNHYAKSRTNQILDALIIFGIMLLVNLIVFGAFGKSGEVIKGFFLGAFGFSFYAFALSMLLVSILMFFGFKRKLSAKFVSIYIAIVLCVIMMCHLATTHEYSSLKYTDYLMYCYKSHNTAGGIIMALFLYPIAKLYVFGMVLLGLAIAGLIALAIVLQLNHDITIHTYKREKKIKNKFDNVIKEEYEVGRLDPNPHKEVQQTKKLYNGTVTGQPLPNDFGKAKGGNGLDGYKPIDNINKLVEEDIRTDNDIESHEIIIDPVEIDNEVDRKRKEALEYLYGTDNDKPDPNDYFVSPTKRGSRFSNKEKKVKPVQNNIDENIEIDPKYRAYSNNYRRLEIERRKRELEKGEQQFEQEDVENNIVNDTFYDDIELALNKHIKENNSSLNDIFNEEPKQIEDRTITQQSESTLDFINKMNKQKEQDEFEKLFENPKTVDFDNKVDEVSSFESYKAQAFGIEKPKPKPAAKPKRRKAYFPPDADCLKDYNERVNDTTDMNSKIAILQSKMANCGIDIEVINIVRGPRFSRIEFTTNTQLSKIRTREKDITMWMAAESMRLLTPVPGKSYCGIEIPNVGRGTVGMKNIVNSPEFNNTKKNSLYFALGKDIDGKNHVVNLCDFPHGLVAGATGAGKSVCLNAMLCSFLYKYSPDELRLILVDPKQVEFNIYSQIPHLLIPNILTQEKETIAAMKWLVKEMEERYDTLREHSVTNISQYNQKVGANDKLPYILLVVDEVGDIVQSSIGKEFEGLVKRLTAKSRAAGIHLILATQRPTVDVITGTIKANIPTRIAFAVADFNNSMQILDCVGAEKLLRYGDMLYKDAIGSPVARIQGCFIDTEEVTNIVTQVKERNECIYDEDLINSIFQEPETEATKAAFPDELCPDVLDFCLDRRAVSITLLQRGFALGFARAAKIHDWLIDCGFVKVEGKNKTFVLTKEQVEEIKRRANGE